VVGRIKGVGQVKIRAKDTGAAKEKAKKAKGPGLPGCADTAEVAAPGWHPPKAMGKESGKVKDTDGARVAARESPPHKGIGADPAK